MLFSLIFESLVPYFMLGMLGNLLPGSSKLSESGSAQVSGVAKARANTSADNVSEETISDVRPAVVQ